MKQDLTSRDDIKRLVDEFYNKVNQDELLAPYFNDAVKVNWDEHLPKMYDFWETVLFAKRAYYGNPMLKHIHVHSLMELSSDAFKRWIDLFYKTLDELFEGSMVEKAKFSANNIATTLQNRIIKQ